MAGKIFIFSSQQQNISSHMTQISEHINSSNHKIHSYDQMRKLIVKLGSKKGKNIDKYSFQLTGLQNPLLMNIFVALKRIYPMLIGNLI